MFRQRGPRSLLAISLMLLAAACTTPTPTPTVIPLRLVEQNSLPLTELWRFHTGPATSWFSTPPHIFITHDTIILSYGVGTNYGEETTDSWLTAFSLMTGETQWQTLLKSRGHGTIISTAYQDSERLYLLYSFAVHAFDLNTGAPVWQLPLSQDNITYRFRPWDAAPPLLLHGNDYSVLTIDPVTGSLPTTAADTDMMRYADTVYIRSSAGLEVVDLLSGATLWTRSEIQPAYRQLQEWPVFVDDDIIYQAGAPCYDINRVTIETGKIRWSTERDYLSNIALAGSLLFALREDLTLVAHSIEDGSVAGTPQFTGPPATTECALSGSDVYWVVAQAGYVIVFMGDTRELIVFALTAIGS